jgi:hypothetical protein
LVRIFIVQSSKILLLLQVSFGLAAPSGAEIKTVIEHTPNDECTPAFRLKTIPAPPKNDPAGRLSFSIVDGVRDENGGGLEVLHDGKLPAAEDQRRENFFFTAGTDGGRLLVELSAATQVWQVDTYSWHPGSRAPQVYTLYASDGTAGDFNREPHRGIDPEKCGWKLLAKVDTRVDATEIGGQYGVKIFAPQGTLGSYRYFLFDITRTETEDPFGNTFYSEIAILDHPPAPVTEETTTTPIVVYRTNSSDGACEIVINTSAAPELKQWAEEKLAPVLAEWYPKLAAMLPSEGFVPPKKFTVIIKPGNGVAATGGTRITANSRWLRKQSGELDPEAVGALLHEEIHVLQQYGRNRDRDPGATRPPGWLVEGIPDYIRWFKFEPESHGADLVWMTHMRNLERIRHDAGYRVSANFLNWVTEKYDPQILRALNAALREATYRPELWKERTNHTVEELAAEWKADVLERVQRMKGN